MAAPTVRPIAPADIPHAHALLRELAEYEKLTHLLTGTQAMLADALFGTGDRLRGLVAEHAQAHAPAPLVGYALFYPVFSSFRARWRLWLEDIYVTPSAHLTVAAPAGPWNGATGAASPRAQPAAHVDESTRRACLPASAARDRHNITSLAPR